jgi:hypothetical protein
MNALQLFCVSLFFTVYCPFQNVREPAPKMDPIPYISITNDLHFSVAPNVAAVTKVLGTCGTYCLLHGNPGGTIGDFEKAAGAILAGAKRLIVIDGPCYSACVILADIARERVCVTRWATFGFHKAFFSKPVFISGTMVRLKEDLSDPPQSPDILKWVAKHKGFPSYDMLVMPYSEALHFWRKCTPNEVLHASFYRRSPVP